MNPSIPAPPNLNDPKYAGAVDLGKVREDAAQAKAERESRSQQAAEEYVARWLKAMKRTFKGVSGASSLDRRFQMRAAMKRYERTGSEVGNFKGSQ